MDRQRVVDVFKQLEIPSWTEGKNVSKGWVNITCPFCTDVSNHLGVNPITERFNCWKCRETGSFVDLLIELTGLSYSECKNLISEPSTTFRESTVDYIDEVFNEKEIVSNRVEKGKAKLPERFELVTYDTKFPLLYSYLERRSISIDTVIEHGCGICRSGQYMHRLIIPIFFCGSLVAYQAADLTGFAKLKYKSSTNYINDYLYKYDEIKGEKAILVEGVLDAWRVGIEVAATFGTHLTERQKHLILEKNLKELIFAWDGDAFWEAKEEAKYFLPFVREVKVVEFPDGEDPDSYGVNYGEEALLELIQGF